MQEFGNYHPDPDPETFQRYYVLNGLKRERERNTLLMLHRGLTSFTTLFIDRQTDTQTDIQTHSDITCRAVKGMIVSSSLDDSV